MTTNPPARSSWARKVWTSIGLVLAIAIVAACTGSVVGSVAYQPLALRHREFSAPITSVSVHVSSGDVTIERSTDLDTEVSTSGVHGLTYPTDQEHVVGRTLVISSSCGLAIPFTIGAPATMSSACRRGWRSWPPPTRAPSMSPAWTARCRSTLDQGDVTVIGGSGTLQASSGQGDVTVSRSGSTSVSVHSGQGDVTVDLKTPPTRVSASSGQGGVTVELPRGPRTYRVQASSGQGNVSDSVGNNPASARSIDATSGQGDVTIGYRSG